MAEYGVLFLGISRRTHGLQHNNEVKCNNNKQQEDQLSLNRKKKKRVVQWRFCERE